MRPVSLRWLLGAAVGLALVLAACSSPNEPAAPRTDNPIVELDGFQAQIEMAKVDLQPLSFFSPPTTSYCAQNVQYAQVIVPMLAMDGWRLTPYADVFWMPRNWNHDLALYAHGFLPPDTSLLDVLAQFQGPTADQRLMQARDLLLCQGYALGASTYSKQGFAVREGVIDTHLMNAVFPFVFWRRPEHTYAFGSSLGGLITVNLAERFPRTYAGAMPTCGPDAGSLFELQYIGNVRMLLGYFASGVGAPAFSPLGLGGTFAGGTVEPPTTLTSDEWSAWQASFVAALSTNPQWQTVVNAMLTTSVAGTVAAAPDLGSFGMQLVQVGPGATAEDVGNALVRPMYYWMLGARDAVDVADGSPFDNTGMTYYDGPTGTTQIFPGTFYGDGNAIAYYLDHYQPTGRTQVPMLALHNLFDPDVPIESDRLYRRLSADAHPSATDRFFKLLTPTDAPYGHCNFTAEQMASGFAYLVERSGSGSWPGTLPSGLALDTGAP